MVALRLTDTTLRTSSYNPLMSVSPSGLVAVGGANICIVICPGTSFLATTPIPESPPIDRRAGSNPLALPASETRLFTVTSLSWGMKDPPLETLLVCWNNTHLFMYSESPTPTTPQWLFHTVTDLSLAVEQAAAGLRVPSAGVSAEQLRFVTTAVFTPNNDVLILTPLSVVVLHDGLTQAAGLYVPGVGREVCCWATPHGVFFAVAMVDGSVAVFRFVAGEVCLVCEGLTERDWCMAKNIELREHSLYVLKGNRLVEINLETLAIRALDVGAQRMMRVWWSFVFLTGEDLFVYNRETAQNDLLARNIGTATVGPGALYMLQVVRKPTNRNIFPEHRVVVADDPTLAPQHDVPAPYLRPLDALWRAMRAECRQLATVSGLDPSKAEHAAAAVETLQRAVTAAVLYRWVGALLRADQTPADLEPSAQEVYAAYWEHSDTAFPRWMEAYRVRRARGCALCGGACSVTRNAAVCAEGHRFELCCATKAPVVRAAGAWRCLVCGAASLLPAAGGETRAGLAGMLAAAGLAARTCFFCGAPLRNLLYL